MRDYPHPEDLGLNPEADRTEILRPGRRDVAQAATRTTSEPTLTKKVGPPMMTHDNPHPVDSTTRHCCGGIGSHTTDCDINLPDPDVPVPNGATADGWNSFDPVTGVLTRSLEWSRHDTGKVGVSVDGWQDSTGEVTRGISFYGVSEGESLTADDAVQLAAALLKAADALRRLPEVR